MKRDENTPLTTGKSPMAWGSIPLLCPAVVSDFTTPERLGGSNRHLTSPFTFAFIKEVRTSPSSVCGWKFGAPPLNSLAEGGCWEVEFILFMTGYSV